MLFSSFLLYFFFRFRIKFYVDDEEFEGTFTSGRTIIQTTQPLFIGGAPEKYKKGRERVGLSSLKGGSIKDFTLNEKYAGDKSIH